MKYFILPFLISFATQVIAVECDINAGQIQLNKCAFDEFKKVDDELNKVYQQLVKRANGNPFALKKLQTSQRLWIKFRDAELDMIFPCKEKNIRYCWGSMIGMLHPKMKQELTQLRIQRLKRYLDPSFYYWVGE
ncbi:MAG: DUF1311 domain-containing protein [Methylococcales bacterium]|nr:DUF1311 domain-containing protein [Methylococcales bacterium]